MSFNEIKNVLMETTPICEDAIKIILEMALPTTFEENKTYPFLSFGYREDTIKVLYRNCDYITYVINNDELITRSKVEYDDNSNEYLYVFDTTLCCSNKNMKIIGKVFEVGKTYFRETYIRTGEKVIREYLVIKRTRCFITFDGYHKMKVRKDKKGNEYVDMKITSPVFSVNLLKQK